MTFDVYFSFVNKVGKVCPGITPKPMDWESIKQVCADAYVRTLVDEFQKGNKESKLKLPAICWMGKCKTGRTRMAENMEPTQLYMIDIDHIERGVKEVWAELKAKDRLLDECMLAHITPSGKGLRLVMLAVRDIPTVVGQIKYAAETWGLDDYGKVDYPCNDLSRISFLVPNDYFLWCKIVEIDMLPKRDYIKRANDDGPEQPRLFADDDASGKTAVHSEGEGNGDGVVVFSDHEEEDYSTFTYRGVNIQKIIDRYVEVKGEPDKGEIHNYYNEMVKNFRCICNNDKRLLLYVLPRFGHSLEECWSQIKSICRVNTLSTLPKAFYFFLKDNGFYNPRIPVDVDLNADVAEPVTPAAPPYCPPVFRELLRTAPADFYVPVVNALLPIMGTLTSYLRATYPYDGRVHSTSFFSVIYAPPGTGKGFVERFIDLLFADLKLRDAVSAMRENIYLRAMQQKGANDKAPDRPRVSLRIIPPKNSEAEFLEKQRDNQGYHMFTYAAEMDSWAKGVKAAGGNKDDMIRIAWDNGEYGQQFKSVNTFKGMVALYWNVLITGTLQQVENYFKNVENGLVTRCSFCSIDNQEYVLAPHWKKLSERDSVVIRRFVKRCDDRTYETSCDVDFDELLGIKDSDFDNEVDWKFKFREKQMVDMGWLMPTIDAFQKEQMTLAARDVDKARDVFRRRVGVRGFRLGLLCYGLWDAPRKVDLENCKRFVNWWMHVDLDNMLKLWGLKYNEQAEVQTKLVQRNVFDSLEKQFTRGDVYAVCSKQGVRTPVRRVIFEWKRLGYIEVVSKNEFKKKVR